MKKYTNQVKEKVFEEYKNGRSDKDICERYGISRATLYNWVKESSLVKRYDNNKSISYKEYCIMKHGKEQAEKELEIFQKLHCFADSSIKEKEEAIAKYAKIYPIKTMCRLLQLPKGTFYNYYFRKATITQNQIRDNDLKEKILEIYLESGKRFGAKKICVKLRELGEITSLPKVQSLMKELDIKSIQQISKKEMLNPSNNMYYINKLQRLFNQDSPNKYWASDVTEVKVGTNKFYLCVVLDLFSRKVVGYRLSSQNNTSLTINTFKDAFEGRNKPQTLSFHSDQGTNYKSFQFRDLLRLLKVNQSFSNKGNPYDNACMESFFSNFKREEYNTKDYEFFDDLQASVDDYMQYYNNYRPHQSLNNKTPNQFEKEFLAINQKSHD